jgi:DNA-binding NarL/FixJ family response regulator
MPAIDSWDALPDPYAAACCRLRQAQVALRRGGIRAPVKDALDRAHEAAITTGARPLRQQVESLATRARVTLVSASLPRATASGREAVPHGADDAARALGLSGREVEVLVLVAEGYSNGQIADRLFISRKTAAVHVTHILDKLGVANRVEAAMVAVRIGLVTDRPRVAPPDDRLPTGYLEDGSS